MNIMQSIRLRWSNGLRRLSVPSSLVVFTLATLVTLAILVLSVKGFAGNPSAVELSSRAWSFDGPLELSPERGRFALLYSIVEDHSPKFSLAVARLAVPDLAITAAGEYVSLFAPAVSFLVAPGYLVGKALGAAQVGAFAAIALFALLNFLLIRSIAMRLGAESRAALMGALTFALATPALPYAGTLYQHHISVFLLLVALWVLVSFRNVWSLGVVWFACALSVVVDNPNLFLMFPIGIYALMRFSEIVRQAGGVKERVTKGVVGIITLLAFLPPVAFFAWYNQAAYGNPFQLPGTLQGVDEIGPDGKPVKVNTYEQEVLTAKQLASLREGGSKEKSALGFFKTRNLYEGFYIHFLSPDRGVLAFAPVVLIGIVGLGLLYRRDRRMTGILVSCIGANVLLYSMWGDPQGGWAFGSRYLIPTYALLAIGIGLALSRWRFYLVVLAIFIPLFTHSLWVNSLGAVTSIANPPKAEVLALEKQSRQVQKYTYERNEDFLGGSLGSKSFVYQAWAKHSMSARTYHAIVFGLGLAIALLVVLVEFVSWRTVGNWITSRRV